MPRLTNTNVPPAQTVIDLLATAMGLLNTIRADCEGDLSRYREEYQVSIDNINGRWERLLDMIYAPERPPVGASRPFTSSSTIVNWDVVEPPEEEPDPPESETSEPSLGELRLSTRLDAMLTERSMPPGSIIDSANIGTRYVEHNPYEGETETSGS
jgi:hypothetical protein